MPIDWENLSSRDLGELYYQYISMPGDYSAENPFHIEPGGFGSSTTYNTPEEYFWHQIPGFTNEMYPYMPHDHEYGPASFERLERIKDIDIDNIRLDNLLERESVEQSFGKSGLSGSGDYLNQKQDLWTKYILQNTGIQDEMSSSMDGVYTQQGQAIYDMILDLTLDDVGGDV
jgi:hypothetical protein|tara:strand:+ start:2179 stop:2697 length:519 start_codon:yes stop_codon:yes gene_type:complete